MDVPSRTPPLPVPDTLDEQGILLGWSLESDHRAPPMGFAKVPEQAPDTLQPILHNATGHFMTFAPTGSGKGVSAVIPNLLHYNGPVIVIDPKGENYAVTRRRREEMGHQIICLDPFDVIADDEPTARLNPLDLIDGRSPNAAEDARMLAEALSYQTYGHRDPFWHVRGKQLLAGLILHVATARAPVLRNLGEVHYLLNQSEEDFKFTLKEMANSRVEAVRQTVGIVSNSAEKMSASIQAMAQTNLGFLNGDQVKHATGDTGFDLAAITRGDPVSIYLLIPPEKLESHGALLRIWISCLIKLILRRREKVERNTLFILDEAAQLGHFPPLRQAITLLRGYGLQTWSFWQDLSQLKRLYPNDWETMYNNCRAHQYFGITTPLLADQIAHLTLKYSYADVLELDADEMLLTLAGDTPVIRRSPTTCPIHRSPNDSTTTPTTSRAMPKSSGPGAGSGRSIRRAAHRNRRR
ncbi:MAG: type IV secretory system conjugative DNA transfer family protein [Gammaproteobacteria bacterium]|jgi:type IV secretion system protein VirD4|nr:type IV secretory system conjugative DNA transfer family protein [Gammaproteobacteria bacterium]